ncbi:MAG: hypothetical protein QXN26_06040 [Thermoplasmataceae archaeon]
MARFKRGLVIIISIIMIGSAITIAAGNASGHAAESARHMHLSNYISSVKSATSEASHSRELSQVSGIQPFVPDTTLTFMEDGLPTGTLWSVLIDNNTFTTANSSLSLTAPPGVYSYTITNSLNFFSPDSSGTINDSHPDEVVHFYGYLHEPGYINASSGSFSSGNGSLNDNAIIPYGIFDNYSKSLVIASYWNDSIILLNSSNYHVTGYLSLESGPGGLAANPDGTIYATTENQLIVISKTMQIAETVNLPTDSVTSVSYNQYSGLIFVGTYSNGTYAFSSDTMNQVAHFPSLDVLSSQGIATDSSNHMTVAADSLNNSVWFIDGTSVYRYWSIPSIPISVLPQSSSDSILVSTYPNDNISLFSLNISTGIVNSIPTGGWSLAIAYDGQTDSAFVSTVSGNGIAAINSQQTSQILFFNTSYEPYFIIFDPSVNSIISGGIYSASLSVFNFSLVPVKVNFTETGLEKGTRWGVKIDNYSSITSNNFLSITAIPGKLNYTVIIPSGYSASVTGEAYVGGKITNIDIIFHRLYSVKFQEIGLPAGTDWGLTLNGTSYFTTQSSLSKNLTAGYYSYSVGADSGYRAALSSGYFEVNGNLTVNVTFSSLVYGVVFISHGLPEGKFWRIDILNRFFTSCNSTIFINTTEGLLNFSVSPVPGFVPDIREGEVNVLANNTVFNIYWKPYLYSVRIEESGLPQNYLWGVTAGGIRETTLASSLVIGQPNGTFVLYPFTVSGDYSANPVDITVNGTGINLSISFSPVKFNVIFIRSNPDPEIQWYVNLSNGFKSGPINGNYYTFNLMNGTYSYDVASSDRIFKPSPSSGTFSVSGATVSVNISFVELKYTVTVKQSGLPQGTEWYLNLSNGDKFSTISDAITFSEPNGTYFYNVATSNRIYEPSVHSGYISVNGRSVTVSVLFQKVTYTVDFLEKSLPDGINWYVNISGLPSSGKIVSGSYQVNLSNGTYSYTIATANKIYAPVHSSGTFTVSGSDVSNVISFSEVTYDVTFYSSGLPAGTVWYVNISRGISSGPISGNSYSLDLPNGTYGFSVASSDSEYMPLFSAGSLVVNGHPVRQDVSFAMVNYSVTINVMNLTRGITWSLYVNGILNATGIHSGTYSLLLPNGTYSFALRASSPNYFPAHLVVVIHGKDISVNTEFKPVLFNITFSIAYPPDVESWILNIAGSSYHINGNSTVISLQNGTYNFRIAGIPGVKVYTSQIEVSGKNITVKVTLTKNIYPVVFRTNLKQGVEWQIYLSDGLNFSSSSKSIMVDLPDGHYVYNVVAFGFYNVTGSFNVTSHRLEIPIHFIRIKENVIFRENGLKPGTEWEISLKGYHNLTSQGKFITLELPDGTYTFTVGNVSGYSVLYDGNFSVDDHAVHISIKFIPLKPTNYAVSFITFVPPGTDLQILVNNFSVSGNVVNLSNGTYNLTVLASVGKFTIFQTFELMINNSAENVFIVITPVIIWIMEVPDLSGSSITLLLPHYLPVRANLPGLYFPVNQFNQY